MGLNRNKEETMRQERPEHSWRRYLHFKVSQSMFVPQMVAATICMADVTMISSAGMSQPAGEPSIGRFLEHQHEELGGSEVKIKGKLDSVITDEEGRILGFVVFGYRIDGAGDPPGIGIPSPPRGNPVVTPPMPKPKPKAQSFVIRPSARWQTQGSQEILGAPQELASSQQWYKGTEIIVTGRENPADIGTVAPDVSLLVGNTISLRGRSVGVNDLPKFNTTKKTDRDFYLLEAINPMKGLSAARALDAPRSLRELNARDVLTRAEEPTPGRER
jgi:hypothetical protein